MLADAPRHGQVEDELDRLQRIPLLIVDEMRAPVSRPHPPSRGRVPVGDQPSIRYLGLGGELLIEPAALWADAHARAVLCRRSAPVSNSRARSFSASAAGRLKRVVLALGQQVPGEYDELAGDGDGRDVRAAGPGGSFPEGAQRAGAAAGDPRRLDQHGAHVPGPVL